MNTIFFFYTLALLLVCIATAMLGLSAWASTRRRLFLYASGVFACYAIETTEIFFFEYISQNKPFPLTDYYEINTPLVRTAVACALQGFIWLMALTMLDKHSKRMFFWPVATFAIANVVVLTAMPSGPWQQWVYYTLRQIFLVGVLLYGVRTYRTSTSDELKARLIRFKRPTLIAFALLACVVIEDFITIMVVPATEHPVWLPLYLSERNFSENLLMCLFAYVIFRYSFHVLSIHMKEAPDHEELSDAEGHIDEIMPLYRQTHNLSARETEVLRMVLLGSSNQEIAGELFLAVGTIKTHVHNILVKTGAKNRDDLIRDFWRS